MSVFSSTRQFTLPIDMLPAVATELMEQMRAQGYEVDGKALMNGVWDISITRGGMFKAVLGMKTALKIMLSPRGADHMVAEASVGIFGQQAVPTIIAVFFLWPVFITQIWGLVQQSKLDDNVMHQIADSIQRHCPGAVNQSAQGTSFCAKCGATLTPGARFCQQCGTPTGIA